MSDKKRGFAQDGHVPIKRGHIPTPATGREQAGHQPTTNQAPPGPPPNQKSGGKK